jgi:hypothetical protein
VPSAAHLHAAGNHEHRQNSRAWPGFLRLCSSLPASAHTCLAAYKQCNRHTQLPGSCWCAAADLQRLGLGWPTSVQGLGAQHRHPHYTGLAPAQVSAAAVPLHLLVGQDHQLLCLCCFEACLKTATPATAVSHTSAGLFICWLPLCCRCAAAAGCLSLGMTCTGWCALRLAATPMTRRWQQACGRRVHGWQGCLLSPW